MNWHRYRLRINRKTNEVKPQRAPAVCISTVHARHWDVTIPPKRNVTAISSKFESPRSTQALEFRICDGGIVSVQQADQSKPCPCLSDGKAVGEQQALEALKTVIISLSENLAILEIKNAAEIRFQLLAGFKSGHICSDGGFGIRCISTSKSLTTTLEVIKFGYSVCSISGCSNGSKSDPEFSILSFDEIMIDRREIQSLQSQSFGSTSVSKNNTRLYYLFKITFIPKEPL